MQIERNSPGGVSASAQDDPPELMQVVLLTSSGKNGAACVAGVDLRTKQFVRFVSDPQTAAGIPFEELRGLSAFDIVELENPQRCPAGPQTENVYVKPFGLRRVGRYSGTIEEIRKEICYPDRRSLAYWEKNRLFNVSGFRHSLELISVSNLILRKTLKKNGGVTTRAEFVYRDKTHRDYRVTDFAYDLREREENEIFIPSADLVLSIPKDDYIRDDYSLGYFKFVAAIFPLASPEPELRQVEPRDNQAESVQPRQKPGPERGEKYYEPWSEREDRQLREEYETGASLNTMAEMHGRTLGAIRARLKKLGMIQ